MIFYYKTNGTTPLKKHVDVDHSLITQMFEEEVNSLMTSNDETQPLKKRTYIFKYFSIKDSYKKKMSHRKNF